MYQNHSTKHVTVFLTLIYTTKYMYTHLTCG